MRTIVVTGADRGLGLSLAEKALQRGERVIASCLDTQSEGPRCLLNRYPGGIELVTLDLERASSVRAACETIRARTDKVDWLINNAGILGDIECSIDDRDLDFDEIEKVIRINSVGTLRMIHELWDSIVAGRERLIVNISSEAGSVGQNWRDRWFGYCMSKAALNMGGALVHTQLRELGGRVMQVHPGYLKTYMHGVKNDAAAIDADDAAELILGEIEKRLEKDVSERPEFFDLYGKALSW